MGVEGEPGCDVIESGDMGVLFLEQLNLTSNPNERTDFPNFRGLLWRCMTQFPDRVEPRSRELSPLLLRFIRLASTVLHVYYVKSLSCVRFKLDQSPSKDPALRSFFCFVVRNEFYHADLQVAPTQDLRKVDRAPLEESRMTVGEDEEGGDDEEEPEEGGRREKKGPPKRAAAK